MVIFNSQRLCVLLRIMSIIIAPTIVVGSFFSVILHRITLIISGIPSSSIFLDFEVYVSFYLHYCDPWTPEVIM